MNLKEWNATNFNRFEMFVKEPLHSSRFFLDHKLTKLDKTSASLYFEMNDDWIYKPFMKYVTKEILLDYSGRDTTVQDFLGFMLQKKEIHSKLMEKLEPEIFFIKELKNKFSNEIDWLTIINQQLLEDSKVTEDHKILIGNPELLRQLLKLFSNTSTE